MEIYYYISYMLNCNFLKHFHIFKMKVFLVMEKFI